jgi:hypothetical protein
VHGKSVLADARAAWYTPEGGQKSLEFVRKVTALGVQCMELHGAPERIAAKTTP